MTAADSEQRAATRTAVLDTIERLGAGDFQGCGAMLAEQFVQEHPYPPMPGVPERIEGRDAFIAFAEPARPASPLCGPHRSRARTLGPHVPHRRADLAHSIAR